MKIIKGKSCILSILLLVSIIGIDAGPLASGNCQHIFIIHIILYILFAYRFVFFILYFIIGICYAGCAAGVVACFSIAGFTFGTVPGAIIAATPALATCNAAFATCESACMVAFFTPTL